MKDLTSVVMSRSFRCAAAILHTRLGRTEDLHQLADDGLDIALPSMRKKG